MMSTEFTIRSERICYVRSSIFAGFIFTILFIAVLPIFAQQTHPFLIVDSTQYDAMRARMNTAPWHTMVTSAESIFRNETRIDITSESVRRCSAKIRNLTDAAALLYIVYPDSQEIYKNKLLTFLADWAVLKTHTNWKPASPSWGTEVPVGGAFFNSVIAYDVIYNDLTVEQRSAIEDNLDDIADDMFDGVFGTHELNQWGASGIWYVFKNHPRKSAAIENYRDRIYYYINDDGVFLNSVNYALARFAGHSTVAKGHFMDVLEFTGEDNAYYSDPRMQKFYHWLFGLAMTPNGYSYTFGDSRGGAVNPAPGIFKMHKFSQAAGAIASWRINRHNYLPKGSLINYVLLDEALPEAQPPVSKIYPDGGAFFIEADADDNSFAAALWNPQADHNHAHKDVNAVHMAAYGEHLIRNTGYNGWGNGYKQFSWSDIHDKAWSNSVVLVNGGDHVTKFGNGIIEGFTTNNFDYACGADGFTLLYETHLRNLIMVHPQDDLDGYFLLFDEVKVLGSNDKVNVLLHGNAELVETVTPNQEYTWSINTFNASTNNAKATAFLASAPDQVSIKEGPLCSKPDNMIGEYIDAEFSVNEDRKRNIVTVVYPHDQTHAKAEMLRISGANYAGAEIALTASVRDYALAADSSTLVQIGNFSFQGLAVLYRTGADSNNFFFLRQGKRFSNGAPLESGFNAAAAVSIYLKNRTGNIVSPGTAVTFYYPGITGIKVDSSLVALQASGENWISAGIPAGNHHLEILAQPVLALPAAPDEILPAHFALQQNYPNPFNPETTISYQLPKSAEVTLEIFTLLGKKLTTLVQSKQAAGVYQVKWDGSDGSGRKLGSGIYFYRLKIGSHWATTHKMVLLK